MNNSLLQILRNILKNASDEEINEIMEPAREGIDCEQCRHLSNVKHITVYPGGFFLCISCIDELKESEPTKKLSKGLSLRFRVLLRDQFKCVYCGRTPREDDVKLEVDHVHPKSKGGQDTMDNLVTACWECNQGKSDLEIEGKFP